MPLEHAMMRIMEDTMSTGALNICAFIMGLSGLAMAIAGVFVKGDTKQTIWGLFGGLFFWTGWVEFMFAYFAARFGVHYDLVGSGFVQTTTEYVNGIGVVALDEAASKARTRFLLSHHDNKTGRPHGTASLCGQLAQ